MELEIKIQSQIEGITTFQNRLWISLDRQEQKDMEHALLELNSNIAIYEKELDEKKMEWDRLKKIGYTELRPTVKSDTACYVEIEKKHEVIFRDIARREDNLKGYNRMQKGFIRFADKINDWFITEQYEEKRQRDLVNYEK